MIYSAMNIENRVIIRNCREDDLEKLMWFGMFYEHKEIIKESFQRHKQKEMIFLVSEYNGFPVGQIWVDFVKGNDPSTGLLWAFRVMDPFQSQGIGIKLLSKSEEILSNNGFQFAEVGVEKYNEPVRYFYEKYGYKEDRETTEYSSYINPFGYKIDTVSDQWIFRKKIEPSGLRRSFADERRVTNR